MKEYLLDITTSKRYNRIKTRTWSALARAPKLRGWIKNVSDGLKLGFLRQSNLFESLNFRYFGPVDGHDIKTLTRVLRDLKDIPGPKLLHVLTTKGKGYRPAEIDQSAWHAPGVFNADTGERAAASRQGGAPRFQDVFGHTLLELARTDDRIVGVTPAMPTGCSMDIMMAEMPGRCFDVGIAEGHAVTFSAGLAASGFVPFCNIYSSFMQRAYDNVIHDVALQGLPVVFCLDRAGLVGEDGPTHHGAYDVAFFRCIPGLILGAPADEVELRDMMYTASLSGRPFVIRYPRGGGSLVDWWQPFSSQEPGRGRMLREGTDVAVITLGPVATAAAAAIECAAAEGVSVCHVDLRYVKPLDEELLASVGSRFSRVITVEDGAVNGGAGSAVMEFFASRGYDCRVERLGIPDRFVEHGTPAQQHAACGYDAEGIYRAIMGK
jgi:1-deoxy-D-xylulose-5-phosphate synthase